MNEQEFNTAYDRITSHGWLTYEEAKLLIEYAEKTEGPILEVGTYMGRSAMLLAALERNVYCVDPWDDHFHSDLTGDQIYERFCENIRLLPNKPKHCVFPFREKIEDWIARPVGFAYLDGDHTPEGTLRQIQKAMECTPTYIAIHDLADNGAGRAIYDVAVEYLGLIEVRVNRLGIWHIKYGTN